MSHIRQIELPNFDHVVNLKQFFLGFDGLHNVAQELSYSVFSKYYCEAACKICYLKEEWETGYSEGTDCSVEQLLAFAEYFDTISSQDDLFLLKHKHPKYFKFYREHGHLFTSCSMTDRAFIQQCNILLDEITFKDIYEITFSEEFLESTGKLYTWILEKLEKLMAKYKVRKIKIVISGNDPSPTTRTFLKCLTDKGLDYSIYDDINLSRNLRHDHTPTNRFDYEGRTYPLFTETCYLQQSRVFLSLRHATKGVYAAYDIREFSPSQFLLEVLKSKVEVYGVYATELCNVSSKYVDYFKFVSSNLTVREDFNFIPEIILGRHSVFYQKLVSSGLYSATPFGLVATLRGNTIIPIIELPKSRQKLEYFSIKCKKGSKSADTVQN